MRNLVRFRLLLVNFELIFQSKDLIFQLKVLSFLLLNDCLFIFQLIRHNLQLFFKINQIQLSCPEFIFLKFKFFNSFGKISVWFDLIHLLSFIYLLKLSYLSQQKFVPILKNVVLLCQIFVIQLQKICI